MGKGAWADSRRISQAPVTRVEDRGGGPLVVPPSLSGVRRVRPISLCRPPHRARTARPSQPCSTSSVSARSTSWRPRPSPPASWTSSPTAAPRRVWTRCRRPPARHEALAELRALADTNTVAVSMIGQGYYDTLTPPVLLRNIMENPAWYTAYTPYQPEISQGRLEALLNFQTMVGRPDRPRDRQRVDARRGHRRRRGHDADAPGRARRRQPVGRRRRRLRPDRRRAGDPRPAAGHRDRHRRPAGRPARRRVLRRHRPAARGQRPDHRLVRADRGGPRARRAGRRRRRPAGADADHPARRHRRRRRVRHHPTIRCANGIRRPARRVPGRARQARPSAAGPAGRRVGRQRRLTGLPAWRCRPASSTSAATRRPATSAPRRCCWR